jgi:MSHA pilin protein MshC
MCARSSSRGFTLPELVAVLILIGVLSVSALPKLQYALTVRDDGWHDAIVAALRHAHTISISRRRLVCASVGASAVTLTIASANPATSCDTALPGLNGNAQAASSNGGATASISPAGVAYFQPSGRISTDGAGSATAARTISITGQPDIALIAETGHVE